MADDSHENGTSNGDVPEIELIIKVSLTRVEQSCGSTGRDRGKRRSCRARYGRGRNGLFLPFLLSSFSSFSECFFSFHIGITSAAGTPVCDEDSDIIRCFENRKAALCDRDQWPFNSSVQLLSRLPYAFLLVDRDWIDSPIDRMPKTRSMTITWTLHRYWNMVVGRKAMLGSFFIFVDD